MLPRFRVVLCEVSCFVMPVERDRALFELLMDLEHISSLRGVGWTFRQVVGQLEWELFLLHRWQRQWREVRNVHIWSYGQLRRTHAYQNLPEVLRRETMANRTSVVIRTESTIASGSIRCNRSFEGGLRSRISLIRLSFSRCHTRLRQYPERAADWGTVWQIMGMSDNRVYVRQRPRCIPRQWLFLSWRCSRRTGFAWVTITCIIINSCSHRLP